MELANNSLKPLNRIDTDGTKVTLHLTFEIGESTIISIGFSTGIDDKQATSK